MSIRIVLADDHAIFREGLRSLIEKETDMSVVGEAGNGIEAVQRAEELIPDIVIMDIAMPEMDGMAFFKAVRSRQDWIAIPFIFLTARGDREEGHPRRVGGGADDHVAGLDAVEEAVGRAVRRSGVPRKELFITTLMA